ncbi:MAG: MTH1187 family thiamine-binding protein [Bacillota bacterium]
MAIVEVKVVPVGTDEASFSSFVSLSRSILERETGLKHQVTPTSTIIQGDLEKVLPVVAKMHNSGFRKGAPRVMTSIFIDERRDEEQSMEQMVAAVEGERP